MFDIKNQRAVRDSLAQELLGCGVPSHVANQCADVAVNATTQAFQKILDVISASALAIPDLDDKLALATSLQVTRNSSAEFMRQMRENSEQGCACIGCTIKALAGRELTDEEEKLIENRYDDAIAIVKELSQKVMN